MAMSKSRTEKHAPVTLAFDKFWSWLQGHANCIVRAGTPEAVLFDHDDYHWNLTVEREEDGLFLVQLVRGKDLVGELVVVPADVAYVQCEPGEGEEFVFECIVEGEAAREAAYHFVLSHGHDDAEAPSKTRWTH
jgi:hypothetical protein